MTSTRSTVLLGTGIALAACAGAPAPQPVAAGPEMVPPIAVTPAAPEKIEPERPPPLVTKLANGLMVAISACAPGEEAQLQLAVFTGAMFVAPGLAELAVEVLVEGADPSEGRPSLVQAVANLGGKVQVDIGPVTSWISLRVPGGEWTNALAAARRALAAPTQSRNQIERIRQDLVHERAAALRSRPDVAMARALMLGEPGTAQYMGALLDRDPSEISLFLSRMYRPERAMLALRVPGEPSEVAAELAQAGSLASWSPPGTGAGVVSMLDRAFTAGLHWSPAKTAGRCRVAFVFFMPDRSGAMAPEVLILHECLTLDGTGGRLEQLQRERGLGHVRWRSEIVQTADALSLVLSADVQQHEVVPLWDTLLLARNSLRDVPPTPNELEFARRRALLAARFGQFDATSSLRLETQLLLRGTTVAAVEKRLAVASQTLDVQAATPAFLKMPVAGIVIGGEVPADLENVHTFDVLPKNFDPGPVTPSSAAATTGAPWLAQAIEAVGGQAALRRFIGVEAEGRLANDRSPAATEHLKWRTDGTLHRTRALLGSKIETELNGSVWTEQLGDQKHTLGSSEVALLRREMQRHPLALLAAHARGELPFRAIAQRNVGDRDLMILEAGGDRFDRLRVHIDTISHLVRVVEVWETMPDGTSVHLQDAWSDYRTTAGLRAPFRRITTQNDGQNRVETVFSSWVPRFSAP